jgi:hypothetical protein
MLTSVSPELRKIGQVCMDLAAIIENSQIEDGDPPFAVNHDAFLLLSHCHKKLGEIAASTTDAG